MRVPSSDADQAAPVKLLLSYDPRPGKREDYFQFFLGEYVPHLEHLGLRMTEAWHTAYGSYPLRLTGFMAPDRDYLDQVLQSETFIQLEVRLLEFVSNYERRIVPADQNFQY